MRPPLGTVVTLGALVTLAAFQVRFIAARGQHLHGLRKAATGRRRAAQGLTLRRADAHSSASSPASSAASASSSAAVR